MDSVNSGSLQSSSGEGDEFNSNSADSLSAIFHSTAGAALSPPQPPPPPSSAFFDPISYLDSITSTTPSWPPRAPPTLSSSDGLKSPSPVQPPDDPPAAAPRSSKKRSRASRRPQTTVLTTDTSNFRAMVQQFTGIPSPPFDIAAAATSASRFARSRFDLFRSGGAAAFGSSSSVPPPPPFLLRPIPLKVQGSTSATATVTAPTIYSSSSTATASFTTSTTVASANSIFNANLNSSVQISTTSSTTNPNQLPSPNRGRGGQSQLSLQSLLHTNCTQLSNMPTFFCTKPQISMQSAELGSTNLGRPSPELMVPDGTRSSWANGSLPEVGDRAQSRLISAGNINGLQQGVSSCKLNYLVAPGSSELDAEKGPDREGMMDSWIFTSD